MEITSNAHISLPLDNLYFELGIIPLYLPHTFHLARYYRSGKTLPSPRTLLWKWATGPEATKSFSIYTQKSTLSFGNYQLFIYCQNVYKRDTLLLYVIYTDAVPGCPDKWRPESDLFAKCYVTGTTMYVR